jgi:citrate lyase subunit beta/citryl-CoA lyase
VAIHPDQLAPIEEAYLPTGDEVEEARATLATVEADGVGMVGSSFVDAAMVGAARTTIALADAYGVT